MVLLISNEYSGFQIIDSNQHALFTEVLDDSIEVRNSKHWGIKFNKQTGLIESWKVIYHQAALNFILSFPVYHCDMLICIGRGKHVLYSVYDTLFI